MDTAPTPRAEALPAPSAPAPSTTVVVPTFNEAGNVAELVRRVAAAFAADPEALGDGVEVLFVDDSTDDTPQRVLEVAASAPVPVHLLHRTRDERTGGLAGAVTAGLARARGAVVVVMDGDLQHPPELVPLLRRRAEEADLVVASRYCGEGDASGLSSSWRRTVSSSSTLLARACFPRRVGRVCTDPMTGFFAVRRGAVDLDRLQPRGFKILLEVLARHDLRVVEVPFAFGERLAGDSKASWRNGLHFLRQMLALRMGRMARFAAVGALGTLVNALVMWLLLHTTGLHYVAAAVLATEVAIVHNFVLQERLVFRDLREGRHGWRARFLQSVVYNNADNLARLPLLALLVEVAHLHPTLAQVLTLVVSFVARFLFVSQVVYRPERTPKEALLATGPVEVGEPGALDGVVPQTAGGGPSDR